jgi:predicted ATPase
MQDVAMNIFEEIHIRGFRRLHDVKVRLNALNVIIGANGSGKTSLLGVFSLLAASASGRLKEAISELGGVDASLTDLSNVKGQKARFLAFDLTMRPPALRQVEYRIALSAQGVGFEISEESLTQQHAEKPPTMQYIQARQGDVRYSERRGERRPLLPPKWEYNATETALSQVPKVLLEAEAFRGRLASSTHYYVLDVGRRAPIRLPQQMRDAQLPGRDGEDLVSCLYTLRETDPDRFETIEATLRSGFPEFERLSFPPVAAGTLAMTWKDKTSKHPFFMHQLSEGTLRFLWLVTLLQSPGLTAVTMIDEPEVSLHPELLSLLADLLREASQRTQLIVATHADRLIRFLKPSEVLTINVGNDGAAEVARADELDLDKWLEEYTLDEIWRMGRIGARS